MLFTMKLLIAVCTIFVLSFISSSEAQCSDKSWVAVKDVQMGNVLGRWYSVLRFANGKDDNSDCLWHDLKVHPKVPNAIYDAAHRSFKVGTHHAKHHINGAVTLSDPSKREARFHVEYQKGSITEKFIVALDNDEYALLRSCYGDDEYFWAYSRNQYPTEDSWAHIYKAIDAVGVNKTKLIKSCTAVRASELV